MSAPPGFGSTVKLLIRKDLLDAARQFNIDLELELDNCIERRVQKAREEIASVKAANNSRAQS